MRSRTLLLAGLSLLASACDLGPPAGPGTMTATVVSPNGAEGSALVLVYGPGIRSVGALDGRVFGEQQGDTVRVVVVRDDAGGTLRFSLEVADTTQSFTGVVLDVAGPDDVLRGGASAYAVEIHR